MICQIPRCRLTAGTLETRRTVIFDSVGEITGDATRDRVLTCPSMKALVALDENCFPGMAYRGTAGLPGGVPARWVFQACGQAMFAYEIRVTGTKGPQPGIRIDAVGQMRQRRLERKLPGQDDPRHFDCVGRPRMARNLRQTNRVFGGETCGRHDQSLLGSPCGHGIEARAILV